MLIAYIFHKLSEHKVLSQKTNSAAHVRASTSGRLTEILEPMLVPRGMSTTTTLRRRGTPRSKGPNNQATVHSNQNRAALHHTSVRTAALRHTGEPSNCTRTFVHRRITTTRYRRTTPEPGGTSPEMWTTERRGVVCVACLRECGILI